MTTSHSTAPWFPLSAAQKSRWFLYQLDPACQGSHNNGFAVRLSGPLDLAALQSALQTLVERHPMLRTRFDQVLGEPRQAVLDDVTLQLHSSDASGLNPQQLQDQVQADCAQPFDLSQAPLMRAHCYQVAADQAVLLLAFDHLVCDGWSYWQVLEQLGQLLSGQTLPAPSDDAAASYQAFVAWQQSWQHSEQADKQWRYWQQQLGQDLPLLALPLDHARPAQQSYRRATVALQLSAAMTAQLQTLARKHAANLFTTLLAGYHILLRRLSGQDDIVIGTPMPGRSSKQFDQVVGDFVNPVAVRNHFDAQQTVAQVLRAVRDATLRGMSNQELPFAELIERLQPERDSLDHPVFQTVLVFQKARHAQDLTALWADSSAAAIHWGPLQLSRFPLQPSGGNAHFPLVLEVLETAIGLHCEFKYNPDLLDQASVTRWAGYLENVLSAMLADDQQAIGTLPLLPQAERDTLLREFNAVAADAVQLNPWPQGVLLHQMFETLAASQGDAPALVYRGASISYAQLNQNANALAQHLLALGVKPDQPVAICLGRGPQMLTGMLAIMKAGGAYLPLDPAYPQDRLAYMLQDSQPAALLTDSTIEASLPAHSVPLVLLDQQNFPADSSNPDPQQLGLTPDHLAYVIYTSGSTGLPKGVMNHHRGLCNFARALSNTFGTGPGSRVLQFASFSFDASIWEAVMALASGASLHLVDPEGLQAGEPLWNTLVEQKISHTLLPGSVVAVWGEAILPHPITLIVGGDACPPAVARHWSRQQRFFNAYGPTEATVCATVHQCQPEFDGTVPIGRPLPNVQVHILDAQGQLVPVGVTGEIHIGGIGVARGYLHRPDLTAQRFIPDPFAGLYAGLSSDSSADDADGAPAAQPAYCYKTGDLGRWLPDGSIEYLGRNDFQVKIRGFRVELGEIEARLLECTGVREAVVLARQLEAGSAAGGAGAAGAAGDKRLVAYLLTDAGFDTSIAALRAQLASRMPAYMVPSAFVCLDAFPLTANGKLDRKALPAPDQGAVLAQAWEAPLGATEQAIASVWQALLGLSQVGRHDHFFELGGHSLMVVGMIERLRLHGIHTDVRTVFAAPTLQALAASVAQPVAAALAVPANLIGPDCMAITPELLPLIDLNQAEIDIIVASVPQGAANVQDIYPLAPPQEGVLFHHLLEKEGDAYLLRASFAIDNRARLDAYLQALQAVLNRHDVLRSSVRWEGLAQSLQVVQRQVTLPLQVLELADRGDAEQEFLRRTDPRKVRLDLRQAPMLTVFIAADPHSSQWYLALLIHHLVCDHISLDIMVAEVQAFLDGKGDSLPAAMPYRDFVVRARSVSASEHEQYFRLQLGDVHTPTTPYGLVNVQSSGDDVLEARHILGPDLSHAIHRCASACRVTAGALFHVAFAQVLAQLCGRDDVVFGTVLSGRLQQADGAGSDIGNVVGMFVNSLPLRVKLAGRSAQEVLQQTWQGLNGLLAHEQAPLALAQRASGLAAGQTLFNALLNYRHSDVSALTGSTVRSAAGMRFLVAEERTNYPFTLNVDDVGQDVILTAQCSGGIPPLQFAELIAAAMAQLVAALGQGTATLAASTASGNTSAASSAAQTNLPAVVPAALPAITVPAAMLATPEVQALPARPAQMALSSHQGRMWFIDTFEAGSLYPASPVYHNIPLLLQMQQPVDAGVLETAINRLLARHEVLRSRIGKQGEAVQIVLEPLASLVLERIACSGEDALEQAIAFTRQPFAFSGGALLRAALVESPQQAPLIALCAHHVVVDRRSMQLLGQELLELCAAAMQGRPAQLSPATLQYADYASWQEQLLTQQREALLFYWRYQLRGQLQAMELPLNRPRPLVHTFTEARASLALGSALTARLKATAKRHQVSDFAIAFTAFNALLRRYAGHDELVVGTSVPCRTQEWAGVVGPLANLLVQRNFVDQHTTLAQLLHQVEHNMQQGLRYQQMQFDQLVLALKPEKDMSRTALFDVLFQFDEAAPQQYQAGNLVADVIETNLGFGKNDLHLYLHAANDNDNDSDSRAQWVAKLVYNADFFDPWLPQQMLRHYQVLLDALCQQPDAVIDQLALLGPDEQRQQLHDWNQTGANWPQDLTVHQLIEQQVARTPDRIAVNLGESSLSYAELNRRANQLAHHLRSIGVVADSMVALCLNRSVDMLVAMLGVMKAGGAYVPIDPTYPAERIAYVLGDCSALCVLSQQSCIDAGLFPLSLPVLALDDNALQATLANYPESNLEHKPTPASGPHNLIYLIYTSGSTGLPKGTMLEHRNVVRLLVNDKLPFEFGSNDVWSLFHSYAFDFSVWEIYGALLYGGRVVMVPDGVRRDPAAVLQMLVQERVTVLNQTPTAFYNLIAEIDKQPALTLPDLRYVIFGGEGLDPVNLDSFARRFPQVALINMYGITETCVHVSFKRIDSSDIASNSRNIGRPIPTTTSLIMDARQQLLPVGVVGEIYVGGDGLGRGYLNRDELTRERFIAHPWQPGQRLYRSGDLGKLYENGEMAHLGRIDDQVQLRGFRIELGEIEVQLANCPGVHEAVVIVREDQPGDKRLVAYLIADEGVTLSALDLRQQLSQVLTEYMVPGAYVTLPRFPLTANGKLDRKALPAPDQSALVTRQYLAPEGEVESTIAAIWCELLGLQQVGRNDQFFELGGHSLTVVTLIERLRQQGLHLEVKNVFTAPTLAAMAQAVSRSADAPAPSVVPANLIPPDCRHISPAMLPLVTLTQSEIDTICAGVPGGAGNVADIYPLTPLQDGILFHHMLGEGGASAGDTYLLRSMLAFDDRDIMQRFLAALQQVIARHDILKSSVHWQGLSQAVQVVQRQAEMPVTILDLPAGQDAMQTLRQHSDPRQMRIDLRHGPLLLAFAVYDPMADKWLMALLNHHLVCDHVTLELIIGEIRLILQGQVAQLPPALPYRNFVAQSRATPVTEHEAWFRAQLADIDEPTAPFGLLDVQGSGDHVAEADLGLPLALAQQIRICARAHGVTVAVLFHLAVAQVLGKCSGRDDVVMGTVLSGRLQGSSGADQVLGMFINTLPVRFSLGAGTVQQVLQQAYQTLTGLLQHEQASLALAQRCSSVASPLPLFSTLFNYRHGNALESSDGMSGMGVPGIKLLAAEERTNYPLTISVDDLGQGFALHVLCADAIDPQRIANYVATAVSALVQALTPGAQSAGAPAAASLPMTHLQILPQAEQQHLLIELNASTRALPAPAPALVHELFAARAASTPQAIALRYREQELSYGDLNQRANQLAHYLIAQGIGPDDRIAICIERSFAMVVGLLGILKAGAAYVPLDPAFPAERLLFMQQDTASKLLLSNDAMLAKLPAELRGALPVLNLDQLAAEFAQQSSSNPAARAMAHHLAYCMYTSGSVGKPKGVAIPHRSILGFMLDVDYVDFSSEGVMLQYSSASWDALTLELWPMLAHGGTVVLYAGENLTPHEIAQAVADYEVNLIWITSTFFNLMVEQELDLLKNLRQLLVGGEQVSPGHVRRALRQLPGLRVVNGYGPSECTVFSSCYPVPPEFADQADDAAQVLPIGKPIGDRRIYVLDQHRQLLPQGVAGELYVAGDSVARCYLNLPELSAERFLDDPFGALKPDGSWSSASSSSSSIATASRMYRSGDLVRWRADGNLEFVGRVDHQVKLRGFRIELGEIEACLKHCPGVREAVVLVREDTPGNKRLVAYMLAQADSTPEQLAANGLREQLIQRMPSYMVPAAFVTLQALPLTSNGKLNRKALPAPDEAALAMREYQAPQGAAEQALAQIWQDLLGLPQVGRDDQFFELGGHSLLIVALIERARQQGLHLDVRSIFDAPTLAGMAAAAKAAPAQAFAVPANRIPPACQAISPDMLPLVQLTQAQIDSIASQVPQGVANIADIYPLAPLQEGILFHHLMQEQRDAYLLRSVFSFDSQQRLDAYLAAMQQVIDRHDILRSAVLWEGLPQPVQVVYRKALLPVHTLELGAGQAVADLTATAVMDELLERTDTSLLRLDVRNAPLLACYRAADPLSGQWFLVLLSHHMVCDHVTLEFIVAEIRALLAAQASGQVAQLPPALPYRNFIAHTHATPASVHEAWFREQLADIDEPTAPYGLLDVQGDGGPVDEVRQNLSADMASRIRQVARQHGINAAVLFHVAVAQVLGHCSGREEVVFGSVLLGRLQGSEGADQVLGMFINTLPLRVSLTGRTVRQVVHETYQRMSQLLAHEQAPLALAQRASGVKAPLPLFSALLNYRHSQVATAHDGGDDADSILEGMRVLRTEDQTNYPFTMRVDDMPQGFAITAQCSRGINSRRIVGYLESALQGLLQALEHAPDSPVARISVLTDAERQLILHDFNQPAQPLLAAPAPLIHQWFEQQADAMPERAAVVYQGQSLSYAELNRRANQLAHHLLGLGVQPDDRVALCLERGLEMAVGLLGIMKAGAGYVPLDPAYPAERLAYMLEDCAPAALVSRSEQLDLLPWIAAPVVALDEDAKTIGRKPASNPQLENLLPQHLAYVIYTSGSTGQPKGVMIEHHNLLASTLARLAVYAPGQHFLLLSSIGFDSSIAGIFGTLVSQGTLHISAPQLAQDPQQLAQYVLDQGITSLLCVPSLARLILDQLGRPQHQQNQQAQQISHSAKLQALIVAGEACPPALRSQVAAMTPPIALYNEYGPTECTVWASSWLCQPDESGPVPIGKPVAGTQIYILDAHLQPVGLNVSGEIYIGGAGVARGYLFRPELSEERFIPDPFAAAGNTARLYKTGDLGRWLPDGRIEYLGRNDFQVKIRGFRIELGEIEARLAEIGGVREAVVLARNDHTDPDQAATAAATAAAEKRLVAYLLVDPSQAPSLASLRQKLGEAMPAYMVPSAFVLMEQFPLTPNGKLDRKALPAPDQEAMSAREYEAPQGATETLIGQIWQDLLGLERVGRHDHFFELGGHSLLVVSMIERLRPHGLLADVRTVFGAPTLAELAKTLEAGDAVAPAFVVPPNRITLGASQITPDMLPLIQLSQAEINTIVANAPQGLANIQDIYPLGPLQEGILFQHLLETEGDSYLARARIEFDSRHRLDAFLGAMQVVIDRHDILRTSVQWDGLPRPVQVVLRDAPLPVEQLQLDAASDAMQQLSQRIDPRHVRLDLRRAPLMAAYIAADPHSEKWFLVLLDHHLICDHVTLEFILAEIQLILQNRAQDLPQALPYRNFIALTDSVPREQHEAWFRQQLGDLDEPTAPFGLLNPAHGAPLSSCQQHVSGARASRLREAARQQKVTLACLFHVVWAHVLARYSGRDDVVFGTVLSGRLQGSDGADQVLGMFINTLPIRLSLAGRSVAEMVADTYRTLTGLLSHEQASLTMAQRCSGLPATTPLLNVLLNYRHSNMVFTPDGEVAAVLEWEGMRVLGAEEQSNYPCTLTVDDTGQDFALTVQCYAEFDARRLFAEVLAAMDALIDTLAQQPQRPFTQLDSLPLAERQLVLQQFNSNQQAWPCDQLIHQLFEAQVARTPDAIALHYDDANGQAQQISYAALNRQANQLAHYLIGQGIVPDSRVAISMLRSLEMVVGLLGILKAGAAYVPVDPGYPAERLGWLLQDCEPAAVLLHAPVAERLAPHCAALGIAPLLLQCNGDGCAAPLADMAQHNPDPQALGLQAQHLAYLIYTSGSTGLPKGVMNQHDGVVNRLLWAQSEYQLNASDRVMQKTPFSFDVSVWEFFLPLLAGAQLVMARPEGHQDPHYLSALIAEKQISTLHFVPSMLQVFLEHADPAQGSSLRRVLCSGEALPYALLQRFAARYPDVELHNLYGPTEAAVDVTSMVCRVGQYPGFVPIGHPIANIRIHILDRHMQLLPQGAVGEIHIGGIGVARGYFNRPELNQERFIADPFAAIFSATGDAGARLYKTGDLGRWLPDGNIEYLGRNDFQVKIRGFRIELGEIEACLCACPGVREAVVVARQVESVAGAAADAGDKRLIAYLVGSEAGVQLDSSALREQLAAQLPLHMVPAAFMQLDAFPLNANGKLDRKALPAPDQTAVASRAYEAPIGEMESSLAQIWQELLGLERVGRHDHFFELGGHSLLAMRLLVRIREVFYVDVPLAKLFLTPTVAQLAELVYAEQMAQFQSEDIERMAEDMDDLSEEELRALLAQEDE